MSPPVHAPLASVWKKMPPGLTSRVTPEWVTLAPDLLLTVNKSGTRSSRRRRLRLSRMGPDAAMVCSAAQLPEMDTNGHEAEAIRGCSFACDCNNHARARGAPELSSGYL
jgi:hypothetical protein